MTGEIEFFRKRFIGGFNRQDVVDHVTKLTKERNDITKEKEKAEEEAKALAAEVDSLRRELDEARKTAADYKVDAIEAAHRTLSELESSFEKLRADIRTRTTGVCADLDAVISTITGVTSIFEPAGSKLAELRSSLEEEKFVPCDEHSWPSVDMNVQTIE